MKESFRATPIDNIKVKYKLIILYIFCVFLPIIIINSVFYIRIGDNLKQHEMNRLKLSLDRIEYNLIKSVKEGVAVSDVLYSDYNLYEKLERTYSDYSDFVDTYIAYLKGVVPKYVTAYFQIKDMTIYNENPTFGFSAGYQPLDDEIKKTSWYSAIKNSKKPIVVLSEIEKDAINTMRTNRYFSIVRKLDNFKQLNTYKKVIKIDFRMEAIKEIFVSEKLEGDLYLVDNKNKVIYSNNSNIKYMQTSLGFDLEQLKKPFSDHFVLINNCSATQYFDGWKVVGIFRSKIYMEKLTQSRNFIIGLTLSSLLLASLIIFLISRSLGTRIQIIERYIKKINERDFIPIDVPKTSDEIGSLINEFNKMVLIIKKLIREVYEASIQKQKLELEKRQSQINALQSQINPHFLFNVLESIKMRCLLKGENETAEIIQHMAKNFRHMVSWGNDLVKVEEEIEFIHTFLKIQQYRFNDKIQYIIEVDDDCRQCLIPKMTFQPLVENAVEHGIGKKRGNGEIRIYMGVIEGKIYCKVEDNGAGIDEKKLNEITSDFEIEGYTSEHVGIKNVYARLKLLYDNQVDFRLYSEKNIGTKVIFKIPIRYE